MKTLKLIFAGIAIATLIYSCSSDRDDEARQKAIEEVKNSNQKTKLKLNQPGQASRDELITKTDSIIVKSLNSSGPSDPTSTTNPEDGGDPTTITPPKR